jgi:hypothetical protein
MRWKMKVPARASGGGPMSTLKQRVIEWAESLPEDCTLTDVRTYLETYLRREQGAPEQEAVASPAEAQAGAPNNLARLEAIGQEVARLGLSAKLAAIQAYLNQRGRTG